MDGIRLTANLVGFSMVAMGAWIGIAPSQLSDAEIKEETHPTWHAMDDFGESELKRQRVQSRVDWAVAFVGAVIQLLVGIV